MKDYKLSEIKKICEEHSTDYYRQCGECPLYYIVCQQLEVAPETWDIDEEEGDEGVLTKEELETTDKIPQKIKEFYDLIIEIEKELASKETARKIFEKIHEKEGYYPLASVGTSQNDMIEIAKGFGIKYTPDGVKVE